MGWQPRPRFPSTPKPPIVPAGQGVPRRPWFEHDHRPTEVHFIGGPSIEVDTGSLRWTGAGHPAAMSTEEFQLFLEEASAEELEAFVASCGPQEISFMVEWPEPPHPAPPPRDP